MSVWDCRDVIYSDATASTLMIHITVLYVLGLGGLLSKRDVILAAILLIYNALTGKLLYYLSELLHHSDGFHQTCSTDWLLLHEP